MLDQYFGVIEGFLAAYGLAAVFLLGVLEEVFFFVPTPFFFVGVGFFMIDAHLKLAAALQVAILKIALPGAFGVLVGGLVIYWLVYWGGRPLVRRLSGYIGFGWEAIENLNKSFKRGHIDEVALVLLRAIPLVPIGIISLFCGLIRLNVREFSWTTFIGTVLRMTGLSLLGWYLGREYVKYAVQVAAIERYALIVILVALVIGLLYWYGRHKQQEEQG